MHVEIAGLFQAMVIFWDALAGSHGSDDGIAGAMKQTNARNGKPNGRCNAVHDKIHGGSINCPIACRLIEPNRQRANVQPNLITLINIVGLHQMLCHCASC